MHIFILQFKMHVFSNCTLWICKGTKIARAVLSDGTTLIKSVTASGVVSETIHKLPEIASVAQRNEVIRDLAKKKINQETIAAMLDVSQSTVSNVLKKK